MNPIPTQPSAPAAVTPPPTKPIYASKTAVVNAVIAASSLVAPFYPPEQAWIEHNSVAILTAIGLINIGLRLITHGKTSLFGDSGS